MGAKKLIIFFSWNDLLKFVFGKINKEQNKYKGREGFNKAIQILKDFKKGFGKFPASNNKGIYTIYNNASNEIWSDFGINNWNDLLKTTFGKIHNEKNKYIGRAGLDKAKKELLRFEKTYGKRPVSKSKGMNTIYTYARLGKWKKYGIASWNDLLEEIFK